MTTTELMDKIFISEYNCIVYESKHHYISFSLIAQGIEFLGRCLDDKHGFDWDDNVTQKGYSGKVFRNAVEKLFPPAYRKFSVKGSRFDLYKNLRCGLIHKLVPHSPIGLTHIEEAKRFKTKHLQVVHDSAGNDVQLILICEDFYEDFLTAVYKVKDMVSRGVLIHPKMTNQLLHIPSTSA